MGVRLGVEVGGGSWVGKLVADGVGLANGTGVMEAGMGLVVTDGAMVAVEIGMGVMVAVEAGIAVAVLTFTRAMSNCARARPLRS